MPFSIDVVVPTARVDFDKLSEIVRLDAPPDVPVAFYIIIDDPASRDIDRVRQLEEDRRVRVILNSSNIGAHASRNVGIDAGIGDYVLFLDDDITPTAELLFAYAEAIRSDQTSPGFVGVASFPPAFNVATKGVLASDILTFWDIAKFRPYLAWGVTANLMVRRSSLGVIRFSEKFPKGGGGEDVDLCLRLVSGSGKWLRAVAAASVTHPWWDGGSRQYKRFARWAYGDGLLPRLHPQFKFRNAPNAVESLFLGTVAGVVLIALGYAPVKLIGLWCVGVVLCEFASETLRLERRWGRISLRTALEAALVRMSNDIGRLVGHLARGNPLGITERFDYFMTGESKAYERKVASAKFGLFIGVAALLILLS